MDQRTWDRIGAACGIPAVVLSPVGFALLVSAGFGGGLQTSPDELAKALGTPAAGLVQAGAYLDVLGSFFFVIFAARLWATLRRAEGDGGWLSATVLAAALMAVAASFVEKSAFLTIGLKVGQGLDLQEATSLLDLAGGSFLLAQAFLGVLFIGAAAASILHGRALPRWLGWGAGAVSLANVAGVALGPDIAFIPFVAFILWMLVASSYLVIRAPVVRERIPGEMVASV